MSHHDHHHHHRRRWLRHVLRAVAGSMLCLLLVAPAAGASGSDGSRRPNTPRPSTKVLLDGLNSPKGLDSLLGQPIVSQGAFGPPGPVLTRIGWPFSSGVTKELSAPISLVDIAVAPDGSMWGLGSDLQLYRKGAFDRQFTVVANIPAYQQTDPDPTNVSEDPAESNPYGVAVAPNGDALVVDAANNDLLRVTRRGVITTVARFAPEVVPTDHLGNPGLPPALPAESVPTAVVAIGNDVYVGELKGFPFRPGSSRIWRLDARAAGAMCSVDPSAARSCRSAATGFTAIQDLDVDRRTGDMFVYQLAAAGVLAFEAGFETGQFPPAVLERVDRRGRRHELAAGQLAQPGGVDVGVGGVLHVTDGVFGNGRLLRVER